MSPHKHDWKYLCVCYTHLFAFNSYFSLFDKFVKLPSHNLDKSIFNIHVNFWFFMCNDYSYLNIIAFTYCLVIL